jgi:hypothetical protein
MDVDANAGPRDERHQDVSDQDDEPVVQPPVMDGAQELQAEAEAAVESGEVDLSDTRRSGPSVVEEPVVRE